MDMIQAPDITIRIARPGNDVKIKLCIIKKYNVNRGYPQVGYAIFYRV